MGDSVYYPCMSSTWRLGAFYCCVMAVSMGSVTRGENTVCLLLDCWLSPEDYTVMAALSARREVLCSYVVLCCICYYCCCASWRRINMSAVSMAPQVFFQPLSSFLVYAGLSKHCGQCQQQDNWCQEQDKKQHSGLPFFFFFNSWVFSTQGLNSCLLYLLHCHVLGHYHFLCISTKTSSNRPLYYILKVEFKCQA